VLREIAILLGAAWGAAAALQLALFAVSLKTKNAGVVDVGWAASFTIIAAIFVALRHAPLAQCGPLALMVAAWSLRLTSYLVARGAAGVHEEGRYVELRRRWSPRANRAFFVFFQAQALLSAALSIAIALPFAAPAGGAAFHIAGAIVFAIALVGEATADAQLRGFKRDPANRGKVCDVGLWGWSRHPNYFFECCIWIAYAIYALPCAYAYLAWLGPAIIVGSIFGVTGISPTENQALRSKGDAYRAYQARVSRFIPLKRTRAERDRP
jgi:steroid 5-alpha reductase family enzyme